MGNAGSSGRRRQHHNQSAVAANHLPSPSQLQLPPPPPPTPPPPQESGGGNRFVFAAETPYPPQYPGPNAAQYYHNSGYYPHPPPPLPTPLPAPYLHHHPHHRPVGTPQEHSHLNWGGGGRFPLPPMAPCIEHQKAVTIRNDVNIKKETLRVEPDENNPGQFLVAFTFDATVDGSITVLFFAKEGFDCNLEPMKESLLKPVTVTFKEGLGQKFRQSCGTGIDFSMFEEEDLLQEGEMEVYPLAVKAEACPSHDNGSGETGQETGTTNSQITQAVFERKEKGQYNVKVVKQILWVNGTRYELQEIYGIGNSVDNDSDGNDPGKECVICLTEPRDTTVLPCRHMCMCSECAKVLRFQTNRCPICRQPVERLLEIKVNNNKPEEQPGDPPAE